MRAASYLWSLLLSALLLTACGGGGGSGSGSLPQPESPAVPEPQNSGYNALLIGHSFFRPFAHGIGELAIDAGFVEHRDTGVFAGGINGRPLSFWEDTGPNNAAIKAALDQGDVDVFGMPGGYLESDDILDGYRQWIAYALERNPDIEIFIGVPWADFPAGWDERAVDAGVETFFEVYEEVFHIGQIHHNLIDTLRAEFPETNIYCIPYGLVALELNALLDSGNLLDDLAFQGKSDALFTDAKGHAGDIIIQGGLLVWLNAIYGVDLSEHEYDTGFVTDLHTLAADIMARHDSTYNREYGAQ
jgi:hypothetical protein